MALWALVGIARKAQEHVCMAPVRNPADRPRPPWSVRAPRKLPIGALGSRASQKTAIMGSGSKFYTLITRSGH